ncbi:MAG: hypothetical protein KAQ62_24680 [Cyclobacteriaceae bacterium]|nr:hypothetical protein [Cyclobacteriaceae bacterium]MCK5468186.1 hypothetical protein [Cyclobacteriaceae bacterium]
MRKQYHYQPSEKGFYAWDVDKLIEESKNLDVIEINISTIKELDEAFWYNGKNDIPTIRSIVDHMKLINEVSLKYPIILSAENLVMDGMHRVSKALFKGISKVRAVKFIKTPLPDFKDIYPDELPY